MAKTRKKLRLTVHSWPGGSINGVVLQAEGKISANLVPEPGVDVTEVTDHGFDADVDREKIVRLAESYKMDVEPGRGRLVRRRQKKS